MASNYGTFRWETAIMTLLAVLSRANSGDIFLEWVVNVNTTINPFKTPQPVITINGMFPGPLINTTTNDVVRLNVFNKLDEPLLFTWNGIEQRLNSWQDGVSGTNCPIQPGTNWTYQFQTKDQIGTFSYFPSINYLKVAGGFGPLRVNNRIVIEVPFVKPETEYDLLIGDWFLKDYKELRSALKSNESSAKIPDVVLMNGKGPYGNANSTSFQSFNVTKGKTYIFRITNVGTTLSLNLRIQNHPMLLVETEGSYPNQITFDSLDVHVGQSYSVLVTANQDEADYYIVASPKMINTTNDSTLVAKGVLHYSNSASPVKNPLPSGPDPFDVEFSVNQSKSIRWNMTAGAARPNPQGTFNVTNVTLTHTFILKGSFSNINGDHRYVVNNVSYLTPDTPLKLADHFANGTGVYKLDEFPIDSVNNRSAVNGVFVVTGIHRGWYEIVFKNDLQVMDSWHLDGFGFYVVGFGHGEWTSGLRSTYNLLDPVVRSTVQVYPGGWTAVYTFLDNQGMWNLRSQHLKHWYMGGELYIRVRNSDARRAKERPPPQNLLLCGNVRNHSLPPAQAPALQSEASLRQRWATAVPVPAPAPAPSPQ